VRKEREGSKVSEDEEEGGVWKERGSYQYGNINWPEGESGKMKKEGKPGTWSVR